MVAAITTDFRTGVCRGAVVVRFTRYCTYRALPAIAAPEYGTELNAVQVPSGTGVLPRRTLTVTAVPDGRSAVQVAAPSVAVVPASKTRDTNVPAATNGVMRSQSIDSFDVLTVKSLTIGRSGVAIVIDCANTCAPSIQYTTFDVFQSIRKRCGAPSQLP